MPGRVVLAAGKAGTEAVEVAGGDHLCGVVVAGDGGPRRARVDVLDLPGGEVAGEGSECGGVVAVFKEFPQGWDRRGGEDGRRRGAAGARCSRAGRG